MTFSFSSIKFWLAFFFIIRLYGITNPPTEISHNWRQSQTCMIARNFEDNNNILYPVIDMEGGKKIAMEFPLFNYIIFLFNKLFGYSHWIGRLINLCFTTAGLYFFFRIINEIHNSKTAFYSTLILTVSIFFSFARKIMPDTFSASLVLAGVFFAFQFIRPVKKIKLVLFFLLSVAFLALGILSKIPSLIFFVFLLVPFTKADVHWSKKIAICMAIIISVGISIAWYGCWNINLLREGALPIIFPSSLTDGFNLTMKHLPGVLEKFYFSALAGYTAFIIFISGFVLVIYKKEKKLLLIFLTALGVFFIFILKTSSFFYYHNYYIIPFAPFMAMIAGYGISQIKNEYGRTALIIISITESILNQQHDFRNRKEMEYKTNLEMLVDKYSSTNQKIFINTGPNPQQLYFAHRKGWLLEEPAKILKHDLDSVSSGSYSLVILDKNVNTIFDSNEFLSVYDDEHYTFLYPKN